MDDFEIDYDAYDLSEFTAADLAHIDSTTREHDSDSDATGCRAARRRVAETSASGGPQVVIALERAADESVVVKVAARGGCESGDDAVGLAQHADEWDRGESGQSFKVANSQSPYEMHKSGGCLSVSDLVRPSWCEVQYSYGLRQGRSRPLANRPDTFVSAEGKVITSDKKVAEVNEKILENGRSVHKELERELHPEQVIFIPETLEELWASRLMDMLARLDTLMQERCCREMPVFGVVQDQPIIGIIDEISLETIPEPEAEPNAHRKRAPTSAKGTSRRSNKRRELSPSQSHITDFSTSTSTSPSKASRSRSPKRPMYELSLKDTKTRRSNSFPSDDDALSSRMQLMLYHHLLSELLSPTFSFSTFWEKVHVDPSEPFSMKFLLEFGLARETDGIMMLGYPECLDDLADFWRSRVDLFCLQAVSPTLEITYRMQPKRGAAPERSGADVLDYFAGMDQEERDLQRAIALNWWDMNHGEGSGTALANGGNSNASSASAQSVAVESTAGPGLSDLHAPTSQPESSNIIGRKMFDFDEAAMQAHVQDVLLWWRGERPPRGVEIEHSHRCFSCEYRESCEWRERKAREAQEKYLEGKFRQMEDTGGLDTT